MFLQAALFTRMFSIIILMVTSSISKAVSCFHSILFSTTLSGKKINQAATLTVELVIYFMSRQ